MALLHSCGNYGQSFGRGPAGIGENHLKYELTLPLHRVAFGIAIGSALNLGIAAWNNATENQGLLNDQGLPNNQDNQIKALREMLGAPFVPAAILLIALGWCMESPRYYMQPNTPHRNPSRAYDILLKARQTKARPLAWRSPVEILSLTFPSYKH